MPVISLWAPWVYWIMFRWKLVETRLHAKFKSLEGQRIGIHVTNKYDKTAFEQAKQYLTEEQFDITRRINHKEYSGFIIGTAIVERHYKAQACDSRIALIDCESVDRYGLLLADVKQCMIGPLKGKQGIWYHDA
jgi:hypothetical protein